MNKALLALIATTVTITGCNGGSNSNSNINIIGSTHQISASQSALTKNIKAAYVDMSSSGSYDMIPPSGFASANVIIFGVADEKSSVISLAQEKSLFKAAQSETAGTINLLSIGGESADIYTFNETTINNIANNIIAQITAFNKQYATDTFKIDGVDLDLKKGINSATVAGLARLFKTANLVVGAAPQVYTTSSLNINSENPSELVLTSGWNEVLNQSNNNVYQAALNAGDIDYLFVQTYNTPNFKIDNIDEQNIHFFKNTAKALNNVVKDQCSGTSICIPTATKIVVGTVANQQGGYFTPFTPNVIAADQQHTLDQLKTDIHSMTDNPDYNHFAGTMVWSLNADYAANLFSATPVYTQGGFSSTIFKATPIPPITPIPHLILEIENKSPDSSGAYKYITVTLHQNGTNYVQFLDKYNEPMSPHQKQRWGTLTSSIDHNSGATHNSNLDKLFTAGSTSVTTNIQINGFKRKTDTIPTFSSICRDSPTFTFLADHHYNITVNTAYRNADLIKDNIVECKVTEVTL